VWFLQDEGCWSRSRSRSPEGMNCALKSLLRVFVWYWEMLLYFFFYFFVILKYWQAWNCFTIQTRFLPTFAKLVLLSSSSLCSPDQIHTASINMPCSCCVAPHQLVTTVVCARAHIYIYMLAQWLDYCTTFLKVKKNSFLQFSFKFLWGLTWYHSMNLIGPKTI